MSEMRVFEVDPLGHDQRSISDLLGTVFGRARDRSAVQQFEQSANATPSLFLAAAEDDQTIGFAAFLAHTILVHGERRTAFQAVDVATSSEHRGKGIFPALVRFAEAELAARKAAFIFGFPNAAAYPIWTKKLGYQETGLTRWRAAALPLIDAISIARDCWPRLPLAIAQDDEELIEWKRRVHGDSLVVARNSSGLLWGVRQRHSVGPLHVPFLHLGGFSFDSRDGFLAAYRQALITAGRPPIARFEAVATNPFLGPFKGGQLQQENFLKVIYKGLAVDEEMLKDCLGLFAGIKDTF